jgi:hypothetical protein
MNKTIIDPIKPKKRAIWKTSETICSFTFFGSTFSLAKGVTFVLFAAVAAFFLFGLGGNFLLLKQERKRKKKKRKS